MNLVSTAGGITLGTSGTSTIGFFGAIAVQQHATNGNVAPGLSGDAVTRGSTFTGGSGSEAYTIGDIVLALKNIGLLAKGA